MMLLTKTPWRDFRTYDIQGPALTEIGHEFIYASGAPEPKDERNFTWVLLTPEQVSIARKTGGLNLISMIKKNKPDIVQLCSLELLPLGIYLKLRKITKVVYDCREDMASALYDRKANFPMFIRKLIFRGVKALENFADRRFDGVITADPGVYEFYPQTPDERKMVCYNTALLEQFPRNYNHPAEREYDCVILGSMTSHRCGTHNLMDAIGLLKQKGIIIKLLMIGEPQNDMVERINKIVDKYQLKDQIHITGIIPHCDVPAILAKARIGIVPLHDYQKFHRNIACKAFEYMACGMPTIASELPPQRLFLDENIARFFTPNDAESLANRIEELYNDYPRIEKMGELARQKMEEQWNGDIEQEKLKKFYSNLIEMPARS